MTTRTPISALAYWDTSVPHDHGWAYRLRFDDDHEESGPMTASDRAAVEPELRALVARWRGKWTAGSAAWREDDGGSLRWTVASDVAAESTEHGDDDPHITDEQLRKLLAEATADADWPLVGDAAAALQGDSAARVRCEMVIAEAAARAAGQPMTAAAVIQAQASAWLVGRGLSGRQADVARLLGVTPQEWGRSVAVGGPSPKESTIRGWLLALAQAGLRMSVTITASATR